MPVVGWESHLVGFVVPMDEILGCHQPVTMLGVAIEVYEPLVAQLDRGGAFSPILARDRRGGRAIGAGGAVGRGQRRFLAGGCRVSSFRNITNRFPSWTIVASITLKPGS